MKPLKKNIDCMSQASMSDLFDYEPKFGTTAPVSDPWDNHAKESGLTFEDGKRGRVSLASTQLTTGMNANSLGRSTLITSELPSRSGPFKYSFTKELFKNRISDFGGKGFGKRIINKPVLSSALKKVEPDSALSLSSGIGGKISFPTRENGSSLSSQLDNLKSHRILQNEASIM